MDSKAGSPEGECAPAIADVDEVDAAAQAAADAGGGAETGANLVELILAQRAEPDVPALDLARAESASERIDGVVVGRLIALGPGGEPWVDYPGIPSAEGLPARAMTVLGQSEVGREVALLFEGGDRNKPVVMGLMHTPRAPAPAATGVEVDGDRLVLTAEKEIVLRCGDASITLTRAGKVLVRGAYVCTRSSGVNRILGGSVQIN